MATACGWDEAGAGVGDVEGAEVVQVRVIEVGGEARGD